MLFGRIRQKGNQTAGGGGPAAPPTYVDTGAGANGSGSVAPSYGTNAAGDLFIARVYRNGGSITTPAGWTLQGTCTGTGLEIKVFTRDARSTGSESGTVTFTATGSSPACAQIDTMRNVATSSFIESVVTASAGGGSSSLNMPTVTPGGVNRYAYAAIGSNGGNSGMASATGESGGDWQELAAEQSSGLGDGVQGQGSTQAGGVAISGGSMVLNSAQGVCVAFALVGV
jgi:hypothetical protein